MNNLTNSIIAVLLLASPLVNAETQYPAADFQPKVLYKDAEYKASPAATVSSSNHKAETASKADAQYPATDFQPKVLYKDDAYKPSPVATSSSSTVKAAASSTKNTQEEVAYTNTESKASEGSKPNLLIVLVVLGLIGFVFYKNKSGNCPSASNKAKGDAGNTYKNAGGLTGVAKYVNRVSGTGVARYLEKHVKAAPAVTGVAKYVAKQVITAKTAKESAATGVEKYMRNRR